MAKKVDNTEEKIQVVEEALGKTELFIEKNQKIADHYYRGNSFGCAWLFWIPKVLYCSPRKGSTIADVHGPEVL